MTRNMEDHEEVERIGSREHLLSSMVPEVSKCKIGFACTIIQIQRGTTNA